MNTKSLSVGHFSLIFDIAHIKEIKRADSPLFFHLFFLLVFALCTPLLFLLLASLTFAPPSLPLSSTHRHNGFLPLSPLPFLSSAPTTPFHHPHTHSLSFFLVFLIHTRIVSYPSLLLFLVNRTNHRRYTSTENKKKQTQSRRALISVKISSLFPSFLHPPPLSFPFDFSSPLLPYRHHPIKSSHPFLLLLCPSPPALSPFYSLLSLSPRFYSLFFLSSLLHCSLLSHTPIILPTHTHSTTNVAVNVPRRPLPQPFVLASPDRVVFRTIPHPIASSNKRVTLSLRRSSPSPNNTSSQIPVNTQSPNTPRQHTPPMSTATDSSSPPSQPLRATPTPIKTTKLTTILTPPTPSSIRKQQTVLIGKNGLPIKSALKSPVTASPTCTGQVRPSTIRSYTSPSALTSPKYVHFNSQLEHVRLFLQGEMPSCVSDRETIVDARQNGESTSDIKLTLTNWSPVAAGTFQPGDINAAGAAPLRVETMALSQDQTELQGKILIHNIAFHKRVSVRYTTDYWQTQTEVAAEYEESIPGSALDRFAFKIPIEMEKTMVERSFCFAVRYQVIGREFWDSNNGMNYQVECKRVVVAAPPAVSDLSKQMNSILLASRMPDYSKPVLKKKNANNRYDLSTSLSAAYSQPIGSTPAWAKRDSIPVAQTAYRPSEYITTPVQSPPGYHHSLYASSPKFVNSYLSAASPPEHFHFGFDQLSLDRSIPIKKQQLSRSQSWSGRDQEASSGFTSFSSSPSASAPISIPTSKAHGMGSSGYYDLVDRYCFYESSPHTSPYSSYPNSPPAPCIRG